MIESADLQTTRLTRRFADLTAVENVDLHLHPGTLTSLVGPSGCGKSTLVSLIAGLQEPDQGSITIDGDDITNLRPEDRPVTVVFQKPLLLPHLNVRDNVAFALRMRGDPRREARARADEMLQRVHLPGAGERAIHELSGGQEQRVALARALVCAPRILLLDEPFSALDTTLREQMRALLHDLVAESHTTSLFVTHDRAEALHGDAVALMDGGALLGAGGPRELYEQPPNLVGARLLGDVNELAGEVRDGVFRMAGSSLRLAAAVPDGPATVGVRPEALRMGTPAASADFVLDGRLRASRFAGDHLLSQVDIGEGTGAVLSLRTPLESSRRVGDSVTVWCPTGSWWVFRS